jgi:hypothetical protein
LRSAAESVSGTPLFGVNTTEQSYRSTMANVAVTLPADLPSVSYVSDIHTCLKLIPLERFGSTGCASGGAGWTG